MSASLTSVEPPVVKRESRQDIRVVSAKLNTATRLRAIWAYRPLLLSLVRKELKVKYKDSVLGFAWSMLNPLFTLGIYYVVFQVILGNNQPAFAIYLLSGLLVWNFFSSALAGSAGSVTGNGAIVKKVAFPREVLPLAAVGAAAFNFMLQLIVMAFALLVGRSLPSPEFFVVAVVAFAVLVCLASALSILLAAINVQFRDTQHLLELVLMLWFWATPITYQFMLVANKLQNKGWPHWLALVNPVTPITLTFQRAFYNRLDPITYNKVTHQANGVIQVLPHEPVVWYLGHLAITLGISAVIMWGALSVFGKLEGNFAEEL